MSDDEFSGPFIRHPGELPLNHPIIQYILSQRAEGIEDTLESERSTEEGEVAHSSFYSHEEGHLVRDPDGNVIPQPSNKQPLHDSDIGTDLARAIMNPTPKQSADSTEAGLSTYGNFRKVIEGK